ncbi:hypothetical protein CEXT_107461 [Caerostris extrusa]|uniref:Uncharacterized protein n=1 Tax=Caerostris extrusa TaxID=172846 RepID=A0AAV4SM31_CAEEX|nr:hypothetical protein CEXT_107461 [Caerostris extrusa]
MKTNYFCRKLRFRNALSFSANKNASAFEKTTVEKHHLIIERSVVQFPLNTKAFLLKSCYASPLGIEAIRKRQVEEAGYF